MSRHTTLQESLTPQHNARKTHTAGATITPAPVSETTSNAQYAKAPRRKNNFPSLNPSENTSTKMNLPTTKEKPKNTPTPKNERPLITKTNNTHKPEQKKEKTTQEKQPTPKSSTKEIKLNTEIISPALIAALTILLLGIILTGISWGWVYAGAVAFVTIGFIVTYTLLYMKTQK